MADFEPNLLAFCCNYCAYRAADLAGTSRMQYPLNVKIIRFPCSGKVDITYILRAFERGADGVIVAGCLKGGCHFVEGNLRAEQRVKFTKDLLNAIGFDGKRLEMFFLSSSMAPRFVEIVNEMTERIRKLGPAFREKVELTKRTSEITKREFLYEMLRNLASKKPEKPIPVPEELKEFGRIDYNLTQCIGCRRCGEVCPEKAIDFIQEFDMPKILQTVSGGGQSKVTKRLLLYETLAKIAVKPPSRAIPVPEGMREFCELHYNPKKCVLCDKCANICPEKAITIVREIDLPSILS